MPLKDPEARRKYETEYRQRPEVQERRRAFYNRPEIKLRQSNYYKEYHRKGAPPGSVEVPPQRFSVVLRQGQFFVKDTETGRTVPCDSRKDAHQRRKRFEERHRIRTLKDARQNAS